MAQPPDEPDHWRKVERISWISSILGLIPNWLGVFIAAVALILTLRQTAKPVEPSQFHSPATPTPPPLVESAPDSISGQTSPTPPTLAFDPPPPEVFPPRTVQPEPKPQILSEAVLPESVEIPQSPKKPVPRLVSTRFPCSEDGGIGDILLWAPAGMTEPDYRDILIAQGTYSATLTTLPSVKGAAEQVKRILQERGIVLTIEEYPTILTSYMADTPSVLYYTPENRATAEDLATRISKATGLPFTVDRGSHPPKGAGLRLIIQCIPAH